MKTIKKYLKVVAIFFAILTFFQGCTVYKSTSVTLDEASKSNNKVRVKTFDNQSLKFDRIVVVNNEIIGSKINKGKRNITLIEKDNIEEIQLKDITMSTILTVVVPVIVIFGIAIIGAGSSGFVGGNIDFGDTAIILN